LLIEVFRLNHKQLLTEIPAEFKHSQLKGEVDQSLYLESVDNLLCTDIIFALLNDSLNTTEPIVYGFTVEASKLNSDIDKRKEKERTEVINRACIAKEMTIELLQEIQNK
jgi:hypothetical protein